MAYGTDEGFEAWLEQQGYTLPNDAPSSTVLRARGTAYVDSYEGLWTGDRTAAFTQEEAWPRTGATLNCTIAVPADAIPPAIVNAAYRAAWLDAETPGILRGGSTAAGQRVKREKVEGAVEVEYFEDAKTAGGAIGFVDAMIDAALRQFVCDQSGGAFLWSIGS
jgi:hypothetical protein